MTKLHSIKLREAKAAHDAALANLRTVQALMHQASPAEPRQAGRVEAARRAHEEALAAHALGEVKPDVVERAKGELQAAEAAHRATTQAAEVVSAEAAARQEGLRRRLEACQEAAQRAEQMLKVAKADWVATELDAADLAYVGAAKALAQAYRRMFALAQHMPPTNRGRPFSLSVSPLAVPSVWRHSQEAAAVHNGGRHGVFVNLYSTDLPASFAKVAMPEIAAELEAAMQPPKIPA